MILVVGGAFQGKHEFVKKMWSDTRVFDLEDLDKETGLLKALKLDGDDINSIISNGDIKPEIFKDGVYVSNLIGCGIVPLKEEDRRYRETMGRLQTFAAKCAKEVYVVTAGIGLRIK